MVQVGPYRPGPLGVALRAARKACGLTQHALAARSHVSQAMISDLERGRVSDASTVLVDRLESVLGASLRTSRTPVGVDEFLASPLAADVTAEEQRLLRSASWLPSDRAASPHDWWILLQWLRRLPRK